MTINHTHKIRVLLVDDSELTLKILERIFLADPQFDVVGKASNGLDALALMRVCQPDVICTDYHMPQMDGLELTRTVMRECPIPILVLSVSVKESNEDNIFRFIEAGAIDVMPKPEKGFIPNSPESEALRKRVRVISKVRVFRRRQTVVEPTVQKIAQAQHEPNANTAALFSMSRHFFADKAAPAVLVIGGSTGAPQGFQHILARLPENFPIPIICALHIGVGFSDSLVEWLDDSSALTVAIAQQGEILRPGHAYFPPESQHIMLNPNCLYLSSNESLQQAYIPSVDLLFESAAHAYGPQVMAVILSGMGKDGARGLQTIAQAGGFTIAQDEASCVVYGMPMEAVKLGSVCKSLPMGSIAAFINAFVDNTTKAPGDVIND